MTIMVEFPPELTEYIRIQIQAEEYIRTRRSEETKNYATVFIRFFIEQGTDWIRAKDIYTALVSPTIIPYTSQVTRMLSELSELGILERREEPRVKGTRGSPPVYYRLPVVLSDVAFIPKKELETELSTCRLRLGIAIKLLQEAGINPDKIEKKVRELTE